MKNKIYIYSDIYLPTFPYLELPMYRYIESKGCEVTYVLQEGDIRLTDPKLSKVFGSLNLVTIRGPKYMPSLMSNGDLLVMRFAYKLTGGDTAQAVRDAGHKILQYDAGGVDIKLRYSPAQYLTAKSKSLKRAVEKKFPNSYKRIFATGSIHYDAAEQNKVDQSCFMKKYGLNPDKKFAILTPANPGEAFMNGIQNDYRNITDIIKNECPNYEIAVKAHPFDYTASMKAQPGIVHKNNHYGGKHSWEKFSPGIKVIKAEEGYKAINACDVVLNIRSSLAIEIPLFAKPIIHINRKKYDTDWPFDTKIMIDIGMSELADTLNSNKYSVDREACKDYCERECYSNDGKAYERTGDIAIQILDGKV